MKLIKEQLFKYLPVLGTIKLDRLTNAPGNRMWRIGGGFNDHRSFVRIDFGSKGWRWTRP